jgi:hypothetical protein
MCRVFGNVLLELIELAESRGLPVSEFGNDNGRLYVKTQGLADAPASVQNAPQGSGETAAARWIRRRMQVEVAGVHRVRKRLASGRLVEYHYAFRGGPKVWKTGDPHPPGSPVYMQTLSAALGEANKVKTKFRQLILDWQKSGEWRDLAPRTKKDYERWVREIDLEFGDGPIDLFDDPAIRPLALEWRDKWSGRQSDYAWTVLKALVSWGYDRGKLKHHHLRGGKLRYKAERQELIWTTDEATKTEAKASPELRDAIILMRTTGLGPKDVCTLTTDMVQATPRGRRIFRRRSKTNQLVGAPLVPEAAEIIDRVPPDRKLVLLSPKRRPWQPEHLSGEIKKAARAAKVREELHPYDLRGTACTRILLAGGTLAEIAIFMGWSLRHAAAMIEVYAALDPALSDTILDKLRPQERDAGVNRDVN